MTLTDSLSGQAAQDLRTLTSLGQGVTAAENAFNNKVNTTNDPGQIAAAQMAFERATQKLNSQMSMMESLNRLISQIIQRLGQIGQ